MSPRARLLFATLSAILFMAVSGRFILSSAELSISQPNPRLRVPIPATAVSYVPIQFKDPKSLGLGKVLVASRGLRDPNFAETVVLLVHYEENGVLGLVLNRRTNVPVSQLFDQKAAKDRSDLVYLGGPVGTSSVFALYQSSVKLEKAENVFGGVYLVSNKGLFDKILSGRPDPGDFHVYVGYAGWTEDQLRGEVQSGAWFVFPADAATVFHSNPDSLWMQLIRKTEMQWTKAEPFTRVFQPWDQESPHRLATIDFR